ncbi:MAG: hypothetical protein WCD35_17385 [Mycobacteriales bacterium]
MSSPYDVWTAPVLPRPTPAPGRWKQDVKAFVGIVVVMVLLGAPAGLLWSAVAPRLTVTVKDSGIDLPNVESTKAFVGADGSYLVVIAVMGVLCGALAWRFARRSGPWTVVALAAGGLLAALIAARVGLRPGAHQAFQALEPGTHVRGRVELFLGKRHGDDLGLRAPWAAVGWPVGALVVFLVMALRRPEELD